MTTQLFKAKNMQSAIGMVNEQFGDDAIILSTKNTNGVVEIKASNDHDVIDSFAKNKQGKKDFTKLFFKNIDEKKIDSQSTKTFIDKKESKSTRESNYSDLKTETQVLNELDSIKKELKNINNYLNGMILTNETSLNDELSFTTPIKLRQQKFSHEIINKLSYSFKGKNTEEGKVSFFRELAKKLSSSDSSRLLKSKNIFIFGLSGSGKSTLVAKLATYISDNNKKSINFIDVSNNSTSHSEILRNFSRVLGFPMKTFKDVSLSNNNSESVNIFDFSGDIDFCLQKIKEIKNNYKEFEFCSILALQSGSNASMIKNVWAKVSDIKPMIAITKLDECWTGAEELSSLAEVRARIGIVTGTKVLIDSILPADEHSLTKYMKENFQSG